MTLLPATYTLPCASAAMALFNAGLELEVAYKQAADELGLGEDGDGSSGTVDHKVL